MDSNFLTLASQIQVEEIYAELGTTEDKIQNDVEAIMEWTRKQPHLPNLEGQKQKVKSFLLACKNSIEKTKQKIEKHYTIKTLLTYLTHIELTNQFIDEINECYVVTPLPILTNDANRITLIHLKTGDMTKFSYPNYSKCVLMSADIRSSKLDNNKKEIIINDLKNYTISHFTAILPHVNNAVLCTMEGLAFRLQSIHLLNVPSFGVSVINLFLNKINKKHATKIYIHKDFEELKKHIDPSILPKNYGGTFPKTSEELMDDWKNELLKHHDWFEDNNKLLVDEKKRVKKSSYTFDSVDGSFRKLEID
ncbi:clavesin-2-like isoform X7 [Daktulosphaira vitifoliae]|uniref:clavesin-2-like isoform X6 n=1 Tax=Daktulosphaira vitifoliae TaxID=58002 RepID=UPI0021A9CE8E|nr:clavesin-2-like isoform X6 [Daktulosphaira vitifoliae]XP_050534118.1 clavesin-2-like isoform X7 [Daktulosphaira vitifoliae]